MASQRENLHEVELASVGRLCTMAEESMKTEHYELIIEDELSPSPTLPALVWAEDIAPPVPSAPLPTGLQEALAEVRQAGEEFIPQELRSRVRGMLRFGRYKPTGRGRPASEYLLRAALAASFPVVNAPVDVNNWISLESGYPASVFDAELSGRRLLLRRGREGESYAFNPSGQILDLCDLLLVCRWSEGRWQPCGSPIKDAMVTKITEATRCVVAVIYAPASEPREPVEVWAKQFATRLASHCKATATGWLLPC